MHTTKNIESHCSNQSLMYTVKSKSMSNLMLNEKSSTIVKWTSTSQISSSLLVTPNVFELTVVEPHITVESSSTACNHKESMISYEINIYLVILIAIWVGAILFVAVVVSSTSHLVRKN